MRCVRRFYNLLLLNQAFSDDNLYIIKHFGSENRNGK